MLKATVKSLLGRKARLLLSAFAIILGVAFVSGSMLFTDRLASSMNGLLKGTLADVNVAAKGAFDPESVESDLPRVEVTRDLIAKINAVDGVEKAYGQISGMTLYPLTKDGKLIAPMGAPTITTNYTDGALSAGHQPGLSLKSGTAPGPDEVLLDPASLDKSGLQVGDMIDFVDGASGQRIQFKIVGSATWSSGTTFGATYVFLNDATAQKYFTKGKDVYQSVWVTADPGADVLQVTQRVQDILPTGLEAVDADKAAETTQAFLNQGLSFINTFLLVFAFIALVVAMFLIVNTFTILVAQRSRELALMRAMGASRGQVRVSVLTEAFVIGLIGATVGIGGGWLLAWGISSLMSGFGMDLGGTLPGLSPTAVIASYAIGILVTMGAAYVPAARASQVPPVAAMTGDFATGKENLGRRTAIAVGLVVIGGLAMAGGILGIVPEALWFIGVGALFVLLGVAGASPLLGRPVTWLLGHLYRLTFGAVGRLAQLNAIRNPRRTAATASALMIGLALITTMAILGQSTKTSIAGLVATSVRGDLAVSAFQGQMAPGVGDKIAKVEGVQEVIRERSMMVSYEKEGMFVYATRKQDFNRTNEQKLESGEFTDKPYTVIAERSWAEKHNYSPGSTFEASFQGKPLTFTITGIFSVPDGTGVGNVQTTFATLEAADAPAIDDRYTVYIDPGADIASVQQRVEDVVKDQPLISVLNRADIADQATASVDTMLTIVYALLALAVIIAVLGIVNTLALSIIERTREIGLLRAIGLTRPQTRRMITLESVVVAVLGAILGLGMGLVFGAALQRSLAEQGLDTLDIPWVQLAAFLVTAVVVGILAAVLPARKAARLDVLQAIATE